MNNNITGTKRPTETPTDEEGPPSQRRRPSVSSNVEKLTATTAQGTRSRKSGRGARNNASSQAEATPDAPMDTNQDVDPNLTVRVLDQEPTVELVYAKLKAALKQANDLSHWIRNSMAGNYVDWDEDIRKTVGNITETIMNVSYNQLLEAFTRVTEYQASVQESLQAINRKLESIELNNIATDERISKLEQKQYTTPIKHTPQPPTSSQSPPTSVNVTTSAKDVIATGPVIRPTSKAPKTDLTPKPAPSENVLNAHHPSRLVIRIKTKLEPSQRRQDHEIVQDINKALQTNDESKHLRVISIKWTAAGNCIVITRADQTAEELAKFKYLFDKYITDEPTTAMVDKQWYKIQIDGVRTAWNTVIFSPEDLDRELRLNNPVYANSSTIELPRWTRPTSELKSQTHSSILITLDKKEEAEHLLHNIRTLALFGRLCKLRRWADRPPIIQCRKCWNYEHRTEACTAKEALCRLCSEPHSEVQHQENCKQCETYRTAETGSMDVDNDSQPCEHSLRCRYCRYEKDVPSNHPSDCRRCPERIKRYGTVRDQSNGEWNTVKPKKKKTSSNTTTPTKTPSQPTNRFSTLSQDNTLPSVENVCNMAKEKGLQASDSQIRRILEATASQSSS